MTETVVAPLTKGEQTRQAVLTAAVRRFGVDGFRATSVADIARDAAVGGTVPYTYFANKEDLFLAALDLDAAGVIEEALPSVLPGGPDQTWSAALFGTLVDAVERHPLARRVMAGLEPHATHRMLELQALADLRAAVVDRLAADQQAGTARADVDPEAVGRGVVTLWISVLMAVVQFGREGIDRYGEDVFAVFAAALDPPAGPDPRPS